MSGINDPVGVLRRCKTRSLDTEETETGVSIVDLDLKFFEARAHDIYEVLPSDAFGFDDYASESGYISLIVPPIERPPFYPRETRLEPLDD